MDDDALDYGEDPCRCHSPDASYRQFTSRYLGVDETDGRYADVEILQCVDCGQLWLRYHVEYEGFSKSGRWARGQLTAEEASAMTPDAAGDAFTAMSGYLYGGSFYGRSGHGRGAMNWD
jgi:hypothetical protein